MPLEPYTASKMIGETLLALYQRVYGIPYIVFRMDSIYGPGQPVQMFISDLIRKFLTEDIIRVGALTVRKNFIYVEDVASAFVAALRAGPRAYNMMYNIGGSHAAFSDIADILRAQILRLRHKEPRLQYDRSLVRSSQFEVTPFRLSIERAHKFLKWRPRYSLKQGILNTIEYIQKHPYV
jgi:nucleoside-diphosphate-sugar epimerase